VQGPENMSIQTYMGDSVSFIFEKRNKLDYGMERRQDLEQMKNYRKRTKI
jgi:hypothetical protein